MRSSQIKNPKAEQQFIPLLLPVCRRKVASTTEHKTGLPVISPSYPLHFPADNLESTMDRLYNQ